MFRVFSAQSMAIVVAAALCASFAVFFTPIAPAAIAQPAAGVHTKGDRLPRLVTDRMLLAILAKLRSEVPIRSAPVGRRRS
jgi:hypothetical protein